MFTSPRSAPFRRMPFFIWAGIWFGLISSVTVLLALGDRAALEMQVLGNVGIFGAALFTAIVCSVAAHRSREARLGWSLMALSWYMGAAGQVLYSLNAVASGSATSSPVVETIAYLGYSVPVVAALFAFPKPPAMLISRFRQVLDAVVITTGLIFVSEATVLQPVREASELQGLAAWSGLAYPIADLAICAVVFALGMRQPPENRRMWLCLGSGLVILAVTDSLYVRLLADGQTNLTATPLVLGWMAAPVLVALAALLPKSWPARRGLDLTLLEQLIPYLPALAAVIVLPGVAFRTDSFLQVTGVVLLLAVTVRQGMIVYENVSLTRDLESKVAARTAELATLGSIVTSSGDAVVGVSMDRIITAWNPAAEALYGLPAAEVLGRPPTFLQPAASRVLDELLHRAQQGQPLDAYETDWVRRDGSTVPVALRISPIESRATVEGISIFGQDIAERRRSAAALERAREEALEASRLKSEFLATMSHEIRTPMNGVIGLTSLLLQSELDESQRRYASGVLNAGEALLAVINDILDFSKLEAGKVVLDPVDFDLRQLVEDVGALLAPAASSKNLELLIHCMPDVPRAVRGDNVRIRQVLLNLASNAVKFTLQGEVTVKVTVISSRDETVRLRFEVSDTGIGISSDDQDQLFQSFSQADASTTRRFGGTGLGLAISRRLVEVMGGEIGLKSEPGVGSTFWFEITVPVLGCSWHSAEDHSSLSGLRVLVVHDNAIDRETIQAQIGSLGMRTDVAEDPGAALQWLRSMSDQGQPYDLVLLDMPEVDGLQLARKITDDPRLCGVAMMMLTSSAQLEPSMLLDAGIGQWLTRPVRSSDLCETLMRLLASNGSSGESAGDESDGSQVIRLPSRGRVLVVEDNRVNQMVAEGLLARLGYETHSVGDGLEALQALQSNSYSAILMDCHMPVMDGYTATQKIRERERDGIRVPIVAMTAGALSEDRDRCLSAGMDDYVSKPVSAQSLDAVLARWVARPAPAPFMQAGPPPSAGCEEFDSEDWIDAHQLAELGGLGPAEDAALLRAIVEQFVTQAGGQLSALRDAARAGDRMQWEDTAHTLKGSASTLGAKRVAALCREAELAARDGRALRSGLLDELQLELERATDALQRIVFSIR